MNTLSFTSGGSARSAVNTIIISPGCGEHYEAAQVRCCSFAKASDIADGVDVRLTNMAGGYPIDYALHDSKNIHLLGKRLTFA